MKLSRGAFNEFLRQSATVHGVAALRHVVAQAVGPFVRYDLSYPEYCPLCKTETVVEEEGSMVCKGCAVVHVTLVMVADHRDNDAAAANDGVGNYGVSPDKTESSANKESSASSEDEEPPFAKLKKLIEGSHSVLP
jgi:hypothetical protein